VTKVSRTRGQQQKITTSIQDGHRISRIGQKWIENGEKKKLTCLNLEKKRKDSTKGQPRSLPITQVECLLHLLGRLLLLSLRVAAGDELV